MEATDRWLTLHNGLAGWIVVDLCDGVMVSYEWDSIELVSGHLENTGKDEFHEFSEIIEVWNADGVLIFAEQSGAEAEARQINEMTVTERAAMGLTGTAVVAFLSRLDDEE